MRFLETNSSFEFRFYGIILCLGKYGRCRTINRQTFLFWIHVRNPYFIFASVSRTKREIEAACMDEQKQFQTGTVVHACM